MHGGGDQGVHPGWRKCAGVSTKKESFGNAIGNPILDEAGGRDRRGGLRWFANAMVRVGVVEKQS